MPVSKHYNIPQLCTIFMSVKIKCFKFCFLNVQEFLNLPMNLFLITVACKL